MTKLSELKQRLMGDPVFRVEYEKADAEFAVVEALVRARMRAKLTQAELASRIGTTQSAIARLEGGNVSPSIATLQRYAKATGARLKIELEALQDR
ncbi:helix-turn-helix domain-containing protein [Pelagibacterium lacus]|uniref:XRE family transcriptional regulator n=1 Tax=Pelagibacterium lacus TaxID=2282655 RepID=A0A369W888_9HYPH|nr:helix-turn-helix transcriptional regulator [Pelagibacterium lacus]RDE10553.1 XRE family transcriptional regulator [Pelagibacterium lacus]